MSYSREKEKNLLHSVCILNQPNANIPLKRDCKLIRGQNTKGLEGYISKFIMTLINVFFEYELLNNGLNIVEAEAVVISVSN